VQVLFIGFQLALNVQIKQITYLDSDILFQILEFVNRIKDATFTLKQYANFIITYCFNNRSSDYITLFGIFDGEKVIAYLQANAPHPLEPTIGYISVAVSARPIPKNIKLEIVGKVEQWLLSKGATCWRMQTRRNPKMWKRLYGLDYIGSVAGEFILEKKIE